MIISGHQPEYLPYLGFFYKMTQCDQFVLVDHVQYEKKSFQNRNYVRTKTDSVLLTVPVLTKGKFSQGINEVMIESSLPWARKHWKTIYLNYKEAPYFAEHRGFFEDLYSKKWERLVDLNLAIIAYVMKALGIERPLALSSEHRITGEKTSMLIDMCQKLGADTYVSGWGGKNYVILDDFRRQGLHHRFVKLNHPQYPQQGQTFIPNLSAVDLLFNCGPESKQILEAACAHSTVEEA